MSQPSSPRPRRPGRPSSGWSVGVLVVAGVIVLHLSLALLIALVHEEPPTPGAAGRPATGRDAGACAEGASGTGAATGACAAVPAQGPGAPEDPPAAPEPAVGGRGSY